MKLRSLTIGLSLLATGTVIGLTAQQFASADVSSGDRPVLVPIETCRIADTRPAPDNVGPKASPLASADIMEVDAQQSGTDCTGKIPAGATALSLNVTALGATSNSFLTIWPDGNRPDASALNPAPGQRVFNAVTTELAPDQTFQIYNNRGNVDVFVDINGYYDNHNHDDRYDTSTEVDTKITDAVAGIPGSGTSYTKAEADDRYDTSTEVDTKITDAVAGIPGSGTSYTKAEADDRFYEGDNVVLVPGDGSPADNGAAFEAALAAIGDAGPDNPYLIRLGAGVFDVGDDGVQLVDQVSVAGAGTRATIVTGPGQVDDFRDDRATIALADDVVLSDLLVRSTGGTDTYAAGVLGTGAGWLVRDVRIEVIGNGADFASGAAMPSLNGSFDYFGVLDRVDIQVDAGTAPPGLIRGVGSRNFFGDTTALTIRDSSIVLNTNGTAIGELAADSTNEGLLVQSTTIRLFDGGIGVGLSGFDPQIFDDVDIEITGGTAPNYGMRSAGSGMRPTISDSRIVVVGAGSGVIRGNTGAITVRNSFLQATSVGMESTGTTSSFAGTYRFDNTTIDAPTAFQITTSGTGTYRFQFGGGKLDASTNVDVTNTGSGSVVTTCVNTWDESYAPVNSDCS